MAKDRTMKTAIGALEAKTRMPELLQQVRGGRRPPDPKAAIGKFQAFLRENPIAPERRADLEALIEEGRG